MNGRLASTSTTRREGIRLLEVKTATGKLTEAQKLTVCSSLPFCIVRSVADALAIYGVHA
jgi:hypothetical protein